MGQHIGHQLGYPRLLACMLVLFAFCGGCQRWNSITARSPGNIEIEILGSDLSNQRAVDMTYWLLPNVGEPTDVKARTKMPIDGWKSNSMLVVLASEPLTLPKRRMGFSKPNDEVLAVLGRETKTRAWILPPLPADATMTPPADSPAALDIDLRNILTRGGWRSYAKPKSIQPFPTDDAGIAALLDRFAVPVDGTLELRRPTEWETQAEFIGTARDEPVRLTIVSRHGENFDPKLAAQCVLLVPFLPLMAISMSSGAPPL